MFEYKAIIRHVVDGDTIDLDIDLGFHMWIVNKRIRLAGIDTPEPRTRDLEEKKYGKLATKYVKDNYPEGSTVIVRTSLDEEDKFGRVLGEVFNEGRFASLNEELVQKHLAVKYEGQSKDQIREAHLKNRELLG